MERSSRDDNANKNSRNATNHGRDLSASQDVSDLSLSQTDESQLQTIISDLTAAFTSSRGLRSEYQLSPDGLKQLVKYSVNKPWEKIRYDYLADTQRFVPRMPSKKHEYTSAQVTFLLLTRIKALYAQQQVKCPFSILGSADIRDGRSLRQPDSSIYHVDIEDPCIILETGHTQSANSLKEKAAAYILTGRGKIRYVFTLKLQKDSQAVDLATWTPEFVRDGQSTVLKAKSAYQTIRDQAGAPSSGAGLTVSMNRITPGGSSPEFPRDQTIKITVEELCEIVKSGENFELGRSEADYEDIPADFVVASSPASSTSTESDHEGRDGYNGAAADEDDFLPRSSHSSRSHRSPIKTRASTRSKTG